VDREQLVIESLPLAAQTAWGIAKGLPRFVDPRDLRQDACIGLLYAARRYNPERNVPFRSFARRRVSGAVLDSLRRSNMPRHARAAYLAEGVAAVVEQLRDPDLVPGPMLDQHERVARRERRTLLAEAIEALPMPFRAVIRARYFEQLMMREIGANLGLHASQVSRLHALGLRLLREYFAIRGFSSFAEVAR